MVAGASLAAIRHLPAFQLPAAFEHSRLASAIALRPDDN
jgi:hypothetical protein